MKPTRNTAQVQGVHLQPTPCADEAEVLDVALDGYRRRPVMARNAEGTLVVCCGRTARKHGWAIEGTLFSSAPPKEPKADKKAERLAKLNAMDAAPKAVPAPVKRRPVATPPKAKELDREVADMLGEKA